MFNTVQLAFAHVTPRKAFLKAIVIGTIFTYLMPYVVAI